MKYLLLLICLFFIGCDSDVNQIVTTNDGNTYDVYTYSTGMFNIPKEAFSIESSGLKIEQIDSVKKEHMKSWEVFKKVW
jgi:hypothetical protein